MKLNPPPQQIPQKWQFNFIVEFVESVRLIFEFVRIRYVASITAGTPQTQAGATQLTGTINNIGTVAVANDGVRLPPALINSVREILNSGANAAQVWPATGDTIDGGAADAVDANTLGVAASRRYFAVNSTDWITLSNG